MKKTITLFFLLFLFIASYNSSFSQVNLNTEKYYLTLNKPGKKKRIYFYVGDELVFKLKGEKFKRTATITNIDSTSVEINNAVEIPLEDFKLIRIQKDSYLANMARKFKVMGLSGGIFIMGLGGANILLGIGGSTALIVGGGVLIGVSQLAGLLTKRNYRLNSYRYLRTIPNWQGRKLE